MFAVLFVVSLMFFAPAAAADCFDDTPKTPFEEVVCADPELSALLADINDLYERLEKASLKPMPLKTERKNWLKKTENKREKAGKKRFFPLVCPEEVDFSGNLW